MAAKGNIIHKGNSFCPSMGLYQYANQKYQNIRNRLELQLEEGELQIKQAILNQ